MQALRATPAPNHAVPNLSWLSPNGCEDAHDCEIGTFDSWLKTEIGPLQASSYFQPGSDGLLIITWDENDQSGSPNCTTTTVGKGCGGQVETVLVSTRSKMAYRSTAGDPPTTTTLRCRQHPAHGRRGARTEHLGLGRSRHAAPHGRLLPVSDWESSAWRVWLSG